MHNLLCTFIPESCLNNNCTGSLRVFEDSIRIDEYPAMVTYIESKGSNKNRKNIVFVKDNVFFKISLVFLNTDRRQTLNSFNFTDNDER